MSKSLGNGVDPMDVIDEYGCDALRFFLTTNSAPGSDLRYDEEKVKSTWNFINKLWNASRFVLMNLEVFEEKDYTLENLSVSDKWMLTKLERTIGEVRKNMETYDFHNVGNTLYSFIWDDFCDWYIELSKSDMSNTNKSVLLKVLTSIVKMLHPSMPYVTEEIYSMLPIKDAESIMISSYPKVEEEYFFDKETEELEKVLEDIVAIRNLKATNGITKSAKVSYEVGDTYKNIYETQLKLDKHEKEVVESITPVTYSSKFITISFYEEIEEDTSKKEEEIKKLEASIERREKLLSNENYVSKAPASIVEADRKKLAEEKEKLELLKK